MHRSLSWESVTRRLVIVGLVLGGLSGGLDRIVIATPAWEHLGPLAWSAYSRYADLGNGLVVYPVVFISWTVVSIAAVITYWLGRNRPRAVGLAVHLSALCMVGTMALTIKAAPIMLGVPRLGTDKSAVQHAFEEFTLYGVRLRGGFIIAAFLGAVWAVAALTQIANAHGHARASAATSHSDS